MVGIRKRCGERQTPSPLLLTTVGIAVGNGDGIALGTSSSSRKASPIPALSSRPLLMVEEEVPSKRVSERVSDNEAPGGSTRDV